MYCELSMASESLDVKNLAQRIDDARNKKGISINALARMTKVDVAQCSRICNGKFRRLGQNVLRICNALRVKLPDFDVVGLPLDPAIEPIAMELDAAWDRSHEDAKRIAAVLRAVSAYRDR